MYTKSQQSKVQYANTTSLLEVLQKHQNDLNLIKFEVAGNHKPIEIKSLADIINYWMSGTRTVFLNGEAHCRQGARRSDLDLFLLCRYYFSMSYEKFTEYFGKLKGLGYKAYEWNTKSPILICDYCRTIKRRVYYQSFTTNSNKIKIKELLDETFGKVKLKISKIPNIGETL